MNKLIEDALGLSEAILDSFTPTQTWGVVNIAKNPQRSFVIEKIPEIPTVFGYTYDNVVNLLEDEKVIEAKEARRWFIGININKSTQYEVDEITLTANSNGYIGFNDEISYYIKLYDYAHIIETGPEYSGQFAILVNRQVLSNFIAKYKTDNKKLQVLPNNFHTRFDADTNILWIGDICIEIPLDSNQQYLCLTILKNDKTKKKKWDFDEILEEWENKGYKKGKIKFDKDNKERWRKPYSAAKEINTRVATKTGIIDFFITPSIKTIHLNSKFA